MMPNTHPHDANGGHYHDWENGKRGDPYVPIEWERSKALDMYIWGSVGATGTGIPDSSMLAPYGLGFWGGLSLIIG